MGGGGGMGMGGGAGGGVEKSKHHAQRCRTVYRLVHRSASMTDERRRQ